MTKTGASGGVVLERGREYGGTGCGDTCGGGGVFTKRKTELPRRNLLQ